MVRNLGQTGCANLCGLKTIAGRFWSLPALHSAARHCAEGPLVKVLRPYQREAVDAAHKFLRSGTGHGLIVVPTGGGKSLVIAQLARELLEGQPGLQIACATHVKELLEQ